MAPGARISRLSGLRSGAHTACLRLPDSVDARDYSGSLVNIITAYAALETAAADGHRGVVETAGNSATGYALAALARSRRTDARILVRSPATQAELERHGIENVVVVDDQTTMESVSERAVALKATVVFDGVGDGGLSLLLPHLPHLPQRSTIYAYGFLAGLEPVSFPSALLMGKDLTLRRFSNFDTPAVRDDQVLERGMRELEAVVVIYYSVPGSAGLLLWVQWMRQWPMRPTQAPKRCSWFGSVSEKVVSGHGRRRRGADC